MPPQERLRRRRALGRRVARRLGRWRLGGRLVARQHLGGRGRRSLLRLVVAPALHGVVVAPGVTTASLARGTPLAARAMCTCYHCCYGTVTDLTAANPKLTHTHTAADPHHFFRDNPTQ